MNVVGTTLTILYKKKVFLDQTICHNLMIYVSMIGEPSLSPVTTAFSPLHTVAQVRVMAQKLCPYSVYGLSHI